MQVHKTKLKQYQNHKSGSLDPARQSIWRSVWKFCMINSPMKLTLGRFSHNLCETNSTINRISKLTPFNEDLVKIYGNLDKGEEVTATHNLFKIGNVESRTPRDKVVPILFPSDNRDETFDSDKRSGW
ncbi:hypothetical protein M8J77_006797 [Diaphorina citri]|nr:hypothetical protein M8J77_006797 [Diaphorina citri]